MDDTSKIKYQLIEMVVISFSDYDIKHVKKVDLNYFQNSEKQQWVWVI